MKISICICFSKKNSRFHYKILNDLNQIIIPNGYILELYFILNSDVKNFHCLMSKIIHKKKLKFKIIKIFEKNIPKTRNIFLKQIKQKNIQYAGFLDDDCKIDRKWLLKMTEFISRYNCDVVGGPQKHYFSNNKFGKLYNFLEPKNNNKEEVDWVATNNCFFKKKIIDRINFKFDETLKNVGGSDQLFFNKLKKNGFCLMWSHDAKVKEYCQNNRENMRWFLKRNFRYGFSGLAIDKNVYGNQMGSLLNIFKIVYLFFISLVNLIFITRSYNFIYSLFLLTKVLGRIMALLGFKLKKYY